ncbi:MAG: S8 family serine peptidase, partial [Bdellovibrionaceae bacterium]|nr:S8 family serine peptidase [Pseudobdellovibrionaceae bacterium]
MKHLLQLSLLFSFLFSFQAHSSEYILKLKNTEKVFADLFFRSQRSVIKLDYNPAAKLFKVEINDSQKLKTLQTTAVDQIDFLIPNQKIQLERNNATPVSILGISLLAQKQWNLEKIRAADAWALAGNRGSRKIVVAVIDSGIDGEHPDLKANLVPGYNFFDNNTNTADKFGHGTHCAG